MKPEYNPATDESWTQFQAALRLGGYGCHQDHGQAAWEADEPPVPGSTALSATEARFAELSEEEQTELERAVLWRAVGEPTARESAPEPRDQTRSPVANPVLQISARRARRKAATWLLGTSLAAAATFVVVLEGSHDQSAVPTLPGYSLVAPPSASRVRGSVDTQTMSAAGANTPAHHYVQGQTLKFLLRTDIPHDQSVGADCYIVWGSQAFSCHTTSTQVTGGNLTLVVQLASAPLSDIVGPATLWAIVRPDAYPAIGPGQLNRLPSGVHALQLPINIDEADR